MPDDPKMLIGGEWIDSASGATFEATSPSTGEVIARVPEGGREDPRRAIAAANAAWRDWASRSVFERAAAMRRMAEIVRERGDDLAGTLSLDQGFEATVVDGVTDEMAIAREETFGPVVPVSTITSEEEAIRIVNGSPYGLLSAVFTRDLRRGLR